MTNYNWIISSMDTALSDDNLNDVVKTVHWRRQANKQVNNKLYIADVYGSVGCTPPDPMAFTPYNQLTLEQVCGWLESNIDVTALDVALDAQIENQINPPIVQLPLPWIPKPTPMQTPEPTHSATTEPIIEESSEPASTSIEESTETTTEG